MHQSLRHEHDMGTITGRLRDVAAAAVDVVAPSTAIDHAAGTMTLTEPIFTEDGAYTEVPIEFTRTALRQQADRFDIPLKYVDFLAAHQPGLLITNLNERSRATNKPTLYRMLRQDPGDGGSVCKVRATLSNGYQAIDNLDVLTAAVRGAARANIDIGGCHVEGDWTDDRFRLCIAIPQIAVAAPELLGDYRSPWSDTGYMPPGLVGDHQVGDVIWAGLEISNSETGGGAASVAPRAFILRCRNGMVRKADMIRSVHLGGRLDEGLVVWSQDTKRKSLELVESRMADAVNQFCSEDYLRGLITEMGKAKGVEVANVTKAMEVAQVKLGFTDEEVDAALNCFVKSGDVSVFGLGQSFTAAAQTVSDGDRQTEIEQSFWDVIARPHEFAGT